MYEHNKCIVSSNYVNVNTQLLKTPNRKLVKTKHTHKNTIQNKNKIQKTIQTKNKYKTKYN